MQCKEMASVHCESHVGSTLIDRQVTMQIYPFKISFNDSLPNFLLDVHPILTSCFDRSDIVFYIT